MARPPKPNARQLRCEHLEDRRLLAVVTVDTIEDVVDFNDGVTSLREAIFATNTVPGADEINFDFGIDGPATILLTQGELQITDSLTISGPGAELLTIDASGNDPTPESTYDDGDDTNDADGSRVFWIEGTGPLVPIEVALDSVTLTGGDVGFDGGSAVYSRETLTISNSLITGNLALDQGAVHSMDSNLLVLDSTVSKNASRSRSGGIRSSYGEATIINSLIVENTAGSNGGGITSVGGLLAIEESEIANNSAGQGGAGVWASGDLFATRVRIADNQVTSIWPGGGGVHLGTGSTAEIADSIITGNSALFGGGVFSRSGYVNVLRSTISNNTARSGGGISASRMVVVTDSEIMGNLAEQNGGGAWGAVSINSSTLSSNSAGQNGGGLYASFGAAVSDSTISGNSAGANGGGVYVSSSDTLLRNNTISKNSAGVNSELDGKGGGIFTGRYLSAVVESTIVAGNLDHSGVAPDLFGMFDIRHTLIGNNSGSSFSEAPVGSPDANGNLIGGATNGIIDPLLGPLADNGGPTLTHALLPGSPAINAGDLNAIAGENGVPDFDQRGAGFDRIVSRIDIGAYEVQELGDLNLLVDTLEDESDGDYSRGDLSLREAIELANANPVPDTIQFDPILTAIAAPEPATILLTQGELQITDSVTISGPGAELLTIDASGNDPTPESTYDDGDDSNDGDGSRIFFVDADRIRTDRTVRVQGLTLTGGDVEFGSAINAYADTVLRGVVVTKNSGVAIDVVGHFNMEHTAVSVNSGGGVKAKGIANISDSLITGNTDGYLVGGINLNGSFRYKSTISNSLVTNNSQLANGAGIAASGILTIVSSTISSNSGQGTGGGVYLQSGELEVHGSNITDNSTTHYGGGIGVHSGSAVISGSDISRNSSGVFGGGISTRLPATIVSSTITNNSSGFGGGGIRTTSELNVTDSKIAGNSSEFGGGGGVLSYGISRFLRSTISGNSSERDGGGIWSQARTLEGLVLSDSTISGNSALGRGGGIYLAGGPLMILGSVISSNYATHSGGGTATRFGSVVTVMKSAISGNSALGLGGGISSDGPLTLTQSSVSNNSANAGGGIRSQSGLRITDSFVKNNTAHLNPGGGVLSYASTTVLRTTISGNAAAGDGGGIWARTTPRGLLTIDASTISNNSTSENGGGVWSDGRSAIINTTIARNSAEDTGGGVWGSGLLTIDHSTVAWNRISSGFDAPRVGSGLFMGGGRLEVDHSIVSNFSGTDIGGFLGVAIELQHSVISDAAVAGQPQPPPAGTPDSTGNLFGVDPQLSPLQDNGGPTHTHALLPGSPAIDSGDPALQQGNVGLTEFDQRGAPYARVVSGRIDIGAFEVQSAVGELFGDFDEDGDVDGTDFLAWQRGFGTEPNAVAADGDATRNGSVDGNDLGVWQATYGERRSVAPERFAAIDAAVAAEYLDSRTTRENVRGAVARRNAFAEPVVGSRAAAWLPVESSTRTDAAEVRSEREQAHEVSDRVELGSVFDDAWADFS